MAAGGGPTAAPLVTVAPLLFAFEVASRNASNVVGRIDGCDSSALYNALRK